MKAKLNLVTPPLLVLLVCTSLQVAAEPIELKLNLQPGERYEMVVTTGSAVKTLVNGIEQDIDSVMEMTQRIDVLPGDGSENTCLDTTISRFAMKSGAGQNVFAYDSDHPEQTPAQLRGIFDAMIGFNIIVCISPEGEMADIRGFDEAVNRIIEGAPEGPVREMMDQQMKQMLNKEMFMQSFEQFVGPYPGRPVSIGDSWEDAMTMAGMIPMDLANTYTLREVNSNEVVLGIESAISVAPDNPGMEISGMTTQSSGSGTQKGYMSYFADTGMIKEGRISQELKLTQVMSSGGQEVMRMPMEISTTVEMAGREIEVAEEEGGK